MVKNMQLIDNKGNRVFSFIDGKFPDGKDFKLSRLKVYRDLKKFKELNEGQ